MTTGNANAAGNGTNPPSMEHAVYVRCAGFRCLAYRDSAGQWRNFFTHEPLPGKVEELSESQPGSSERA